MKDDELVRALRQVHAKYRNRFLGGPELVEIGQLLDKAADTIEQLEKENAELKEAIKRYCHNDCYRDACTGNEDVGIPDCALAKHSPPPLPQPPKGE